MSNGSGAAHNASVKTIPNPNPKPASPPKES